MGVGYLFKCPDCRKYNVKADTFKQFVTDEQWEELQESIKKGACVTVLEFDTKCPQCAEGRFKITSTLKVLKKSQKPQSA